MKKRSFNKKGKQGSDKKKEDVENKPATSSLATVSSFKEFVPQNPPVALFPAQETKEGDKPDKKPSGLKTFYRKRRCGNKKTDDKMDAKSSEVKQESVASEVVEILEEKEQTTSKKPRKPRTRKSKQAGEMQANSSTQPQQNADQQSADIQPPQPKPRRNRTNNRKQPLLIRSDSAASTLSSVSTMSAMSTSDLPLRDKLEKELMKQRYFCPICMDVVKRNQLIWSCRECYCVIHLQCMKQWVFQNLDQTTLASLPKLAKDPFKFWDIFIITALQQWLHVVLYVVVSNKCLALCLAVTVVMV